MHACMCSCKSYTVYAFLMRINTPRSLTVISLRLNKGLNTIHFDLAVLYDIFNMFY